MKLTSHLFAAASAAFLASTASAMVAYPGVYLETVGQTHQQDFNTLDSVVGIKYPDWANNSTLPGWYLYKQPASGTAITSYGVNAGATNESRFWSYGATGSSDRALGGLVSVGDYFGNPVEGAVAGWIAFAATNGTGETLTGAAIKFDGEQWRNGGNTSGQAMVLEYGFGSAFEDVTWTPTASSFNWTSPVTGATAAAVDGNGAGRVANVGGTLSNLEWSANDTLWVRWIETNNTGNDHGLAIDNFSITAIPEPSTYAAVFGALALGFAAWKRRRG